MAARNKLRPVTLQRRGSGLSIPISKALAASLNWNRDDIIKPAIVDGCLILMRVDLPRVPDLRSIPKGDHAS